MPKGEFHARQCRIEIGATCRLRSGAKCFLFFRVCRLDALLDLVELLAGSGTVRFVNGSHQLLSGLEPAFFGTEKFHTSFF